MSMKKKASAAVALTAAAAIALSGTLAYFSNTTATNEFVGSSKEVTKEVKPHDDFDGENKDVYLENLGDEDVWVRVKLSEDFKISPLYGGDMTYEQGWNHLVETGTNKPYGEHVHQSTADSTDALICKDGSNFHTNYIGWEMGGEGKTFLSASSKLYLDDTLDNTTGLDADNVYWGGDNNSKTVAQDNDGKGVEIIKAQLTAAKEAYNTDKSEVLSDSEEDNKKLAAWLEEKLTDAKVTLAEKEKALDEKEATGSEDDPADVTEEQAAVDAAQKIVDQYEAWVDAQSALVKAPECTVITMAAYKQLSTDAKNSFEGWIIDTDGWAYWSKALKPGTATGLLLNKLNIQPKLSEEKYDWEYDIHVDFEAVDATDIGLWTTTTQTKDSDGNEVGNRAASADAKAVLEAAGATAGRLTNVPTGFTNTVEDGSGNKLFAWSDASKAAGVYYSYAREALVIGKATESDGTVTAVDIVTGVSGRTSGALLSTGTAIVANGGNIAKIGKVVADSSAEGGYYYTIRGAADGYKVLAGKDGVLGTLDDVIVDSVDGLKLGKVDLDSDNTAEAMEWRYMGGPVSKMYLIANKIPTKSSIYWTKDKGKTYGLSVQELYEGANEQFPLASESGTALIDTPVADIQSVAGATGLTAVSYKLFLPTLADLKQAYTEVSDRTAANPDFWYWCNPFFTGNEKNGDGLCLIQQNGAESIRSLTYTTATRCAVRWCTQANLTK